MKRRPKVARRWAESVGSGSGGSGRARPARRASIAGERSKWQARREHDPTEGQDSGGPGGRGAATRTPTVVGQREEPDGTDGTQVASEKRPQPRGIFGVSFWFNFE